MGVVIDVTNEILEKNKIKEERDYDPLTMIYNRKAAQLRIENIIENVIPQDTAALIMFDLDYLKPITISGGLLWIENWTLKYDKLLHKADELLYEAKNVQKGFYIEGAGGGTHSQVLKSEPIVDNNYCSKNRPH